MDLTFLSTLSLRRATCGRRVGLPVAGHFYPRSPCGERRWLLTNILMSRKYFYPRSPCGERHKCFMKHTNVLYFYPRSPCGERRESQPPCGHPTTNFYPRSPCGERRVVSSAGTTGKSFLSTLSLRRATPALHNILELFAFLSTLSLRRATHAPSHNPCSHSNFYPRSPCGERLSTYRHQGRQNPISIHALLAESDDFKRLGLLGWLNFYPRSPCGERRNTRNSAERV